VTTVILNVIRNECNAAEYIADHVEGFERNVIKLLIMPLYD
jgi:hypothetical protein